MNIRNTYLKLIILITLIAVFAGYRTSQASSAGISTKVRSDDGKHKVIKEACAVCHKDEEFDFLIMIYSTRKKGGAGTDGEGAGTDQSDMVFAPTVSGEVNFHEGINCLFCHQVGEMAKPIPDKFITVDGKLTSLCSLCHSGVTDYHFIPAKRIKEQELLALLTSYGLKMNEDGSVNCGTCHTVHANNAFGSSITSAFRPFITNSTFFKPHGSKVTCIACHKLQPKPDESVTFINNDYEKICRKCHTDDIKEHHVTGKKSASTSFLMDFLELPLRNEEIYCSTCHDEPCYKRIDPKNKKFLTNGPYENLEQFCDSCHKREASQSKNVHKQLDVKGNIVKKQCAICHEVFPEDGLPVVLTAPVTDLCIECHTLFNHPDQDHLVEIVDKKLDNLLSYQEMFKVDFPLNKDGFITCVTCHNPHAKGVIKGLGSVGAGEYMNLRGVSFEEACTPCHGKIY